MCVAVFETPTLVMSRLARPLSKRSSIAST